jgi:hypothetical protein
MGYDMKRQGAKDAKRLAAVHSMRNFVHNGDNDWFGLSDADLP